MKGHDRLLVLITVLVVAYLCIIAFVWHDHLSACVLAIVWGTALRAYYKRRGEPRKPARRL